MSTKFIGDIHGSVVFDVNNDKSINNDGIKAISKKKESPRTAPWVKVAIIILAVAVVFLTISVCNYYWCHYRFDGNSAGVIISALGILVTFLVGWNIYNFIDFKNKLEKLDEDQNFLGECQLKAADSIGKNKAQMLRFVAITWSANVLAHTPNKKLCMMIGAAIGCIDIYTIHNDSKTANEVLNNLLEWINMAKDINLNVTEKRELQKIYNAMSNISDLNRIDELRIYLFGE